MSRFTQCKYVKVPTEGKQSPGNPEIPQRKSFAMGGGQKNVPAIPTPFRKDGKTV